jgi:hypothetical protein
MKNMAQTPGQRLKETVQEEGAKLLLVPEVARVGLGNRNWAT